MELDRLPLDIIGLILQAIESPKQLYRLISASPACFRVFHQSRKLLLCGLLENSIPQGVIRHALAVVSVPDERPQLEAFLKEYFRSSSSPKLSTLPTKKLVELCRLNTRISYFVDDYMRATTNNLRTFLEEIRQEDPSSLPEVPDNHETDASDSVLASQLLASPSRTEIARLQRGFLRLELYSKSFTRKLGTEYGSSHTKEEQAELFVSQLERWEVEEMSCVFQYHSILVESRVVDLENHLVEAVLAAPGQLKFGRKKEQNPSQALEESRAQYTSQEDQEQSSSDEDSEDDFSDDDYNYNAPDDFLTRHRDDVSEDGYISYDEFMIPDGVEISDENFDLLDDDMTPDGTDPLVPFKDLDWYGLTLYSDEGEGSVSWLYIGYLVSIGLDLLYPLAQGDQATRARLIGKHSMMDRDFLPHTVHIATRSTASAESTAPSAEAMAESEYKPDNGEDKDVRHPTPGYRAFQHLAPRMPGGNSYLSMSTYEFDGLVLSGLRALGWVFWDSTRINDATMTATLHQANRMDVDRLMTCGNRKSAERRLRGVWLPRSHFKRILQDFGSRVFDSLKAYEKSLNNPSSHER